MKPLRRLAKSSRVILGLAMILATDVVWACPNCKDSLVHNDPTAAGIVQGYFWSIILMLSMPFLLLAALSTYFYILVRRARKQATVASDSAEPIAVPTSSLPAWSPSLDS